MKKSAKWIGLAIGATLLAQLGISQQPVSARKRPVVIGHRGASGYLPEHTLAAYRLAIDQGADFIEPDLVPTKDAVLIARHENEISETTDVSSHPEFASRKRQNTVDGVSGTGWFTEDFTLKELKTLKTRGRSREAKQFDNQYPIVTFDEILQFVKKEESRTGRQIGIYPETKHPSYFRRIGLPIEETLLRQLSQYGYTRSDSRCYIQSFEVANLKSLKLRTKLPLMQLVDDEGSPQDFVESGDPRSFADLLTEGGLAEVARYASGIAISKRLAFHLSEDQELLDPTDLISRAHSKGLLVHGWTFRAENRYLPKRFRRGTDPEGFGDLTGEVRAFFDAGLDGVFCNHPDYAVKALKPVGSQK